MKKLILIFAVCALNFIFFQNFTSITDEEKSSWGSSISDTEDNTYDDFKSALDASNETLKDATKAWNDDFEEVEPEEEVQEQEVGLADEIKEPSL